MSGRRHGSVVTLPLSASYVYTGAGSARHAEVKLIAKLAREADCRSTAILRADIPYSCSTQLSRKNCYKTRTQPGFRVWNPTTAIIADCQYQAGVVLRKINLDVAGSFLLEGVLECVGH